MKRRVIDISEAAKNFEHIEIPNLLVSIIKETSTLSLKSNIDQKDQMVLINFLRFRADEIFVRLLLICENVEQINFVKNELFTREFLYSIFLHLDAKNIIYYFI